MPKDRRSASIATARTTAANSNRVPLPPPAVGLAVGGLAALMYATTLGHGFVWDDPISVHSWLPALRSWWACFFPPGNIPQFPSDYYRPLQLLSYRVDHAIGDGAPWAFHLTAVVLHVVATVFVFHTGFRLFGRGSTAWWAALWAAALFAVHPIHSESVAWMAARPDVMVTCAGLAALLAYWHTAWSAWRRSSIAAALVFAGLLCKENAASLLVLVPASTLALRHASGGKTRIEAAVLLSFGAAAVAYLLLRTAGLNETVPETAWPPSPLLALLGTAGAYLRLLIVPYPQNAYIGDAPTDVASLAIGVLLLIGFGALLWWAWRRNDRPSVFAFAWLALTLAPSLLAVARPSIAPLAERYLYLPSVGFCWIFGALIERLAACGRRWRRLAVAGAVIVVLTGGTLTVERNCVWQDNYTLWNDTAAKNTVHGLPLRSLAAATLERGDVDAAEPLFHAALGLMNSAHGHYIIYSNLGTIASKRGDDVTAERYYRRALESEHTAAGLYNLALLVLKRALQRDASADAAARAAQGREARSLFEQALALTPYDVEVHLGLAQAAAAHGDIATARRHFEKALELRLPPTTTAAVRQRLEALD